MQKDIKVKFIPGKVRVKYGGAVVGKDEKQAINRVLDRNWWTLDEEGRLFEKELAKTSRVKYSVLTNSGSSALLLAISSLNLRKGSEIIIPAVNFPTAVNAILLSGCKPVFIDSDVGTYCLNLSQVEKAIAKSTKAILAVHIAGNVCDLGKLRRIAKKYNLFTILDNCDGYGSKFDDKPVESLVDVAVTSFHAAHIITTGEGGAFFTNNEEWKNRAISLREWGRAFDTNISRAGEFPTLPEDYQPRYTYVTRGMNLKPLELQAAMGRVQLRKLNMIKKQRMENFRRLFSGLKPLEKWIILPKYHKKADVSWFSFPITLKDGVSRKDIFKFLEDKNIETRVIFAGNILRQPAYLDVDCRVSGKLVNADYILKNSFFVSVHPSLTTEMIDYVISSIKEFFAVSK